MVALRQRSITESIRSRSVLAPASRAGVAAGLAVRPQRRRQFAGSACASAAPRRRRRRTPRAVPSEGMKVSRFARGVRHRRADQRLVAVVRQPHHEQRAALGDDGGVDLGRALRHEAEEHAVLAAFLGDARQRAPGRAEADLLVGRRVAVRLLADEQQRRDAVAPQAEVEGHAAEHRHHRVDHLGREAGELHDGHRLAVRPAGGTDGRASPPWCRRRHWRSRT